MGKKIILFSLFLLFGLVGYAEEYKNIDSLEPGDWLLIESVEYYPYVAPGVEEEVPWRNENVRRTVLKAIVTEVDTKQISFDFQVDYLYDVKNIEGGEAFWYYDSRYKSDFPTGERDIWMTLKEGEWAFPDREEIVASASYDRASGIMTALECPYDNLYYIYAANRVDYGLKNEQTNALPKHLQLNRGIIDLQPVIEYEMERLFAQKEKPITTAIRRAIKPTEARKERMQKVGDIPANEAGLTETRETRVVDASFSLPPNVSIHLETPEMTTIFYEAFYLSHPTLYFHIDREHINQYIHMYLSPGDSVRVKRFENGEVEYKGNRSREEYELIWEIQRVDQYVFSSRSPEDYLQHQKKRFDQLIEKCDTILDSYWKRVLELSRDYMLASSNLTFKLYGENTGQMIGDSASIRSIAPLYDYQYNPSGYENFLITYVDYKRRDMATETISNRNHPSNHSFEQKYYFADQLLAGYPKYRVSHRYLLQKMYADNLSESQAEYEHFMQTCPDIALRNLIRKIYEQLLPLEKGNKIQDTDITLAKKAVSTWGNDREYVVMEISPYIPSGNNSYSDIDRLNKLLQTKGITDKIQCYFYALEPRDANQEKFDQYLYIPDTTLVASLASFDPYIGVFLVMRKDGTILYRCTNRFWSPDKVANLIAQDLNRASSPFWLGFWRGFGFTFLFAVLAVGIIRYRLNLKRKKEEQQRKIKELELKAIRSQMNPHFVFNALGSIQNLINRGDNAKANEYLVQFSRMVRMVLNHSEKKMVALSEEIEQLYLYLNLEQLRFPFVYAVTVDETIETDLVEIPGMLIQPFVENAVKHGIAPRGEGNILIDIRQRGKVLQIDITDDGPGLNGQPSEGFGVKAVQEEFQILKELYETEPTITICDRKETEQVSGCRVTLAIPIN
ncbi:two-component sensor histidine kinase [Parabacteroides sp. PFB2-10]|uniref:sensor histidine kinase n=1 Tax=Parabacteroides sp. PFB2-10 TaxID=1742405 RepID=UPI0024759A90|nr:histidine kinase [Parabacteroides sp. PFB2-10]MDH6311266.1 two-component sensor histidine kinase [Parabacteroides sp. PFB2-10]